MARNFIILTFLLTLCGRSISATPHSLSKREATIITQATEINCGNNHFYTGQDAINAAQAAALRYADYNLEDYPLDVTAIFNGRYPGTRGPYKLYPLLSEKVFRGKAYRGADFVLVDELFRPIGAVTLRNQAYQSCVVV
ncbi:hypothetical protein K3495_g3958 [Podosphaera aphanis]|nr:hypothetical protein K3495_g3958 [Podosphaera aphanis]